MWNDLIIVAFKGGSGGDFLTNEINKAIDPTHTYSMTPYNKSNFKNPLDPFATPCLVLYYLECLFNNDPKGGFSQFSDEIESKVVDWIYDKDPEKIMDNLREEMRGAVSHLQNKRAAINVKYFNRAGPPFEKFSMDWVFPSSKKFILGYEHTNKYLLMAALFFKTPWIPPNYEVFIDKQFQYDYVNDYTSFEDFTQIFVDKLYFGDFSYVYEVEDMISSKVGYKVDLDKEAFKRYRENNVIAYRKFVGDDYLTKKYTKQTFMDLFEKMREYGYVDGKYTKL